MSLRVIEVRVGCDVCRRVLETDEVELFFVEPFDDGTIWQHEHDTATAVCRTCQSVLTVAELNHIDNHRLESNNKETEAIRAHLGFRLAWRERERPQRRNVP
jgi:hypothetical protein